MMSTFKKLTASVFVLSLTACASQAPQLNTASSHSAMTTAVYDSGEVTGDSVVRLELEPKEQQESGILGRVVKTVAGVAAPALGIYRVATGMVADTVVLAAIETAAAKLAVEESVSNVVNQADLQQLNQLVLIKDQATDAVATEVSDAVEQLQGVDAIQLISQVDAQYSGAQSIQNTICSNANPQQLARLQAVDSGQGWIDLGYDVQLQGNVSQPLLVRESDFGSLCSQTADQKVQKLRNRQEVS